MSQPEVSIEQGTLRGSIGTNLRGDKFYKFQGIPYAKPPLGELRFKAPVPPEKWTGTFDATKEGDICYQLDPVRNGQISGSENCLVLNVYTKQVLPDKLKPVMFWIHGGGFASGNGGEDWYGPEFLIAEDIVLVTINYRLGMFGFLSFEDPFLAIPGNAGLKDQVMALKWVQKNISKFGGDPNNVTIFGESAGGAAVHLLVLSPMGRGLFHRAIAQSGCALNPWVKGTLGVPKLAPVMDLEGSDERTVYDALMEKSSQEILEIASKLDDPTKLNEVRSLSVVVENNLEGAFMTEEPLNIILSGNINQVPLIIGYTSKEGMLFAMMKNLLQTEFAMENMVPLSFGYQNGTPETAAIAEKMKEFYFGDEDPTMDVQYDVMSDFWFISGIYLSIMAHLASSRTPIYLYRVSVESELNFFKKFVQVQEPGVCHCDDIGYLFKLSDGPEIEPGSLEDISLTKFVKLWTNFAIFGNPTPSPNDLEVVWKPITGPNLDYLDIGKELVASTNPESERTNFWKKLFVESPAGENVDCVYLK